ncbi:MAG TPA: autotransporter-associated beta strand repeat-containing protein, partial [Gammaproteobacteria bacterium]|nr:autotransporter-associated beta strand repeat-containing protein [Gammaproteobacteria bacterium]
MINLRLIGILVRLKFAGRALCVASLLFLSTNSLYALPQGGVVSGGNVTISTPAADTMQINQASQKGIVDWQSYNVGQAEHVNYQQPNASAITLNRIDPNSGPAKIYGSITANGQVWLINPAGVWFGPTAHVDVGGLLASTAGIGNADFMSGNYHFVQSPDWRGAVINEGYIKTSQAGLVALIGSGVVNNGYIESEAGSVVLASGSEFTVNFSGNDLVSFTVDKEVVQSALDQNGQPLRDGVKNSGTISANGGKVLMTARTASQVLDNAINMSGVVEAKSVGIRHGVIILGATGGKIKVSGKLIASGRQAGEKGGKIHITAKRIEVVDKAVLDVSGDQGGGEILVGGDAHGANPAISNATSVYFGPDAVATADAISFGDGGKVVIWADQDTYFYGSISARGGAMGGNGGWVETSGKAYLDVATARVNTLAPAGLTGTWLLDPTNIYIATNQAAATTAGMVGTDSTANVNNAGTFQASGAVQDSLLTVANLVAGLGSSNIIVTTTNASGTGLGNITVVNAVTWASANTLTLTAANNIVINAAITTGTAASRLILNAVGTITQTAVIAGSGGITLSSGTFTASQANTYSGVTTIDGGVFTASNTGALGTSSSIAVATGAALRVTVASLTNANTITLNGTGNAGAGALQFSANNTSISNPLSLSTTSSIVGTGTGTYTFSGAITGTGTNLTINLASGLSFPAVTLTSGGSLSVTTSGAISQTGFLSIAGTSSFTAGAGTISLASNNNFTGAVALSNSGANAVSLTGGVGLLMGLVNVGQNLTLTASTAGITQNSTITATTLTTSSVSGTTLTNNNVVTNFNGTDTAGGISFTDSVATLTVTGIAQSNNNNVTITNTGGSNSITISNPITLPGTNLLTLSATNNIALNGAITTGTAGSKLILSAGGTITQSASIGGSGGVTLSAGTFTASRANTYSGPTTINGGIFSVTNAAAPGTSAITVASGGALQLTVATLTNANSITLNGTGNAGAGALQFTANNMNLGSAITLGSASSIKGSGTGTYNIANNITGTGDLTINLTSAGINLPGIALLGTSNITVNTSGAITQSAVISTAGTASFTSGAAAITLGQNNIIQGAISLANTGANNVSLVNTFGTTTLGTVNVGQNLNVSASGTLVQTGPITATTLTTSSSSGTTLTNSSNSVTNFNATNTTSGNISFTDSIATLTVTGISQANSNNMTITNNTGNITVSNPITLPNVGTLALSATGNIALNAAISTSGGSVLSLNASSAISQTTAISGPGGVLLLGGTFTTIANTYTGATTLNGGTFVIAADSGLGNAPVSATPGQLTFNGGTLQNTATLTLNANRGIALNASGGTLSTNSATTLTYNGIIAGAGALTKAGTGTLTLGASTNTYSGATNINAGTLSIDSDARLGTAPGTPTADQLTFNGGTLLITVSFILNANRGITLNAGGGTFSTNLGLTYNGIIAGTGALTKTLTNTLTLGGVNTYSGATIINQGTVSIAADSGLGTAPGSPTVGQLTLDNGTLQTTASFTLDSNRGITLGAGGGTFLTNAATTLTYGGIIASTGALSKGGTGTLILSGANPNTYSGTTSIGSGVIELQTNSTLGNGVGGVTISSGAALNINRTGASIANGFTINGTGISSGGVIRNITGTNTITGNILLSTASRINSDAGTLTLSPSSTGITGTGLGLTVGGSGNTTINTNGINTGAAGTLIKDGSGTLTVNANGTYTGSTTINGGVLAIDADLRLGAAPGAATPGQLTFNGGTLETTAGFTLNANRGVALSAGGGTFLVDPATTLIYNGIIAGAGTLTKAGTGTLTLGGANSYSGATILNAGILSINADARLGTAPGSATPGQLTFNGGTLQTTASFTLNANRGTALSAGGGTFSTDPATTLIYNGIIAGAGTLTKAGTGTLTLGVATNTYSGATNINAGTLSIDADARLGTAPGTPTPGQLTFNGGTLLTTAPFILNANRGITLNAGGGTLSTNLALTYNGIIAGTGALTKTASGTLTLGGVNTYSGATTINTGTLAIAADSGLGTAPGSPTVGQLTFNGGILQTTATFTLDSNRGITLSAGGGTFLTDPATTLTYGGVIASTGALTKAATGTLILSGSNTYSGTTTINGGGGVIELQTNGTLGNGVGGVTVNSGTALNLNLTGATIANAIAISGTGISNGGALRNITGSNQLTGSITITGGAARINSDAGTLTLAPTVSGIVGPGAALTVGGSGNTTINTNGINTSTGGTLIKDGSGTLTVNANGSYTGSTTINAGVLAIDADLRLGVAPGSPTAGQLTFNGGTLETTATFTLNANRGVTLSAGGGTFLVDPATTLTYGGIAASTGTLTKSGTGTLTLGGVNTYSGATIINAGILSIAADSGLGTAPGSATPGQLTFNGGSLQTTASFTLNANRGTALSAGGGTFSIGGGTTLTYNGIVAGTGTLTKSVTGALILGGVNTYSGATIINAGSLSIAADSGLGTAPGSATPGQLTFNGGTLQTTASFTLNANRGIALSAGGGSFLVNNTTTLTYNGIIAGTGTLTTTGPGTLILGGVNTYSGATILNAGILSIAADSALGTAPGTPTAGQLTFNAGTLESTATFTLNTNRSTTLSAGGGTFLVDPATTLTYGGVISSTGALTKSGTGTLILSGANSYSGNTTISSGVIELQLSGTVGNGVGGVNISSGTALNLNLTGASLANAMVINGTGISNGGALRNITGSNQLTGNITISGGAARINSDAGTLTLASTVSGIIGPPGSALTIGGSGNTTITTNGIKTSTGGTLIKDGSGTLTINAAGDYTGSTTINAGVLAIDADNRLGAAPGSPTAGQLTFNGGTLETTATFTLNANRGVTLSAGGGTFLVDPATTLTYNGIIASTGTLTKSGTGTLILGGANTYSGATILNAGVLAIDTDSRLGTAPGSPTAGQLTFNGGTLETTTTFTLNANRGITLSAGGGTLLVDPATTLTYNGIIASTGTLTKSGTGTLILGGANTYSGATILNAGVLAIDSDARLGTAPGVATPDSLIFNGGTLETTATFTLNANRGITLASILGTFLVDPATTLTYSGIIAGTGALAKSGTGTLILGGVNTYSSLTNIDVGVIELQSNGTLGASINIASGAALNINRTGASIAGNFNISDTGIANGGAIRNISGTNTITGNIVLSTASRINSDAGTLNLSPAVTGITGTGLALTIGGSGNTTINANGIKTSTGGTLIKDGSGTLTINAAGDYTGSTTITAGVLAINADSSLGAVPGSPTAGNLVFNGGTLETTATFTLNANRGIALTASGNFFVDPATTLTYNGIIAGSSALNKSGTGTLVLGGVNTYSGVTTINAGVLAIDADSRLGAAPGSPTAGSLVFNGGTLDTVATFTLNANRGIALTAAGNFLVDPATTLTYNGIIAGSGALNKSGTGTLALGGINTYSGASNVNVGIVSVQNSAAFGSSSLVTVLSGAAVEINGSGFSIANNFNIAGTGVSNNGVIRNLANSNTISGNIVLSSSAAIGVDAGTLTLGGVVSGTSLSKNGAGTLILSGNNTYTGSTTFNAGTLAIDADSRLGAVPGSPTTGKLVFNGGTLDTTATFTLNANRGITLSTSGNFLVDPATTLTYNGIIAGVGAFTKSGTGTLVLGGPSTYIGASNISAGIISLQNATGLGASPLVTVASGAAVEINGSGFTIVNNFNIAGTGVSNNGVIRNLANSNDILGNVALSSPATLNVDAGTLTLDGVVSGTALSKNGSGTLVLTTTNTYTGITNVNAGIVTLQNAAGFGSSSLVTVASGAAVEIDGSGFSIANNFDIAGTGTSTNGVLRNLANSNTISGTIALSSPAAIGVDAGTLTLSGVVSGTALSKNGAGTLVLSANNTYTGSTTLNAGVLSIDADSRLGTAPGSATAGSLVFNGGTLDTTATFTLNANRGIALTAAGNFLVDPATTLTYNGIIAGSGALNKSGTGTLVLGGVNTYSGATNVSTGIVSLQNAAGFGSSSLVTVLSNAAVEINGSGFSIANNFDIAGTGVSNNGVIRNLANSNTISGNIALSSPAAIGADAGTLTLSGVLSGTALSKNGAGTLVLSGNNTYTGSTTLNAGVLAIDADSRLGTAPGSATPSSLVFNGGTLDTTATFTLNANRGIALTAAGNFLVDPATTLTYNGIIAGSGALNKSGTGTLVLGGVNTYSGVTTINAGTLAIDADSRLGTAPGSATAGSLVFNGGTLDTTATFTLNANRGIALTASGNFLVDPATTLTYNGIIAGSGALNKSGTGTLALGGVNTYSGATNVSTGIISLQNAAGFGSSSLVTVLNNAAVEINGSGFNITNNFDIAGTGVSNNGVIRNLANSNTISGTIALSSPAAIGVDAGTLTLSGVVSGTSLSKNGAGTLVLSGNNTYTGSTTLNA